ncbi:hypothetical protein BDZ89DRAFT_954844 [Hymenopellis radicata]|nr:hypothetical protein BDZ89DRAFT_954844 [Hymenopellis radicata]
MAEFQEQFGVVFDYILARESHRSIGQPCDCKRPDALKTILCFDCFHSHPACPSCFLESHRFCPTHWAHRWNGRCFDKLDQSDLGYIFTFSHDHGPNRCPHGDYDHPLDFILTDLNGVHRTKATFCRCAMHGKPEDRFTELLACGIFPATVARPTMGFTFALMEDFHLQTLTSKKSPYDYIEAIRRKTTNAVPDLRKVPNPYEQFLRVQRVFRAVTGIKRSGQLFGIDRFFPNRPPGSVVVACFACPEPGFNVPDRYWIEIDDDFIHLVQLILMLDGHFGLQRFAKVDDPDDVSLLAGKGHFPLDEIYNVYVRNVVATEEEKSTCSNFNAVEMQNKIKFRGCVISGVIAVECGRHCVFLSMVDLHKGERFTNADFALIMVFQRFVSSHSINLARFFRRILTTYDVACQFEIHFGTRVLKNFPNLAEMLPALVDLIKFLVPKMHLDGHKDNCRYRYSLNYFQGAGRTYAEGIEGSWAESKQSGGSTRQMNHGHRHDTIIDFHNFWNWAKFERMSTSLCDHLISARESLKESIEHFLGLSVTRGRDNVEKWEKMSTLPVKVGNEWRSVYRAYILVVPSREAVYLDLLKTEKAHDDAEALAMKTQNQETQFLNAGLKLQERQHQLKRAQKAASTETELGVVRRSRAALLGDIRRWRKEQIQLVPMLSKLASSEDGNENDQILVETEKLYLPSDFSPAERSQLGLVTLAEVELKLREGEANDAVVFLCEAITHVMMFRSVKEKHARGVSQNTRAAKFIRGVNDRRNAYADQYRRARKAVLALKAINESSDYPILTQEDMYAKNAVNARELGDGSKTDGWIWRYGNLKGLNQEQRKEFVRESTCFMMSMDFLSLIPYLGS